MYFDLVLEEFEGIKGVIRIGISKRSDNTMAKRKKYKRTNNDLQNMHIKLKIEQHEPHYAYLQFYFIVTINLT